MSYVAPPPANPIKIDPAVDYKYVIAQQGAASMSVAPVTGFTFTKTFGSPALIRVKWTGAAPGSPTNHTLTVTLPQTAGGSLTHTVTFQVLPAGPRTIPDIQNGRQLNVTAGQSVDVTIATDIDVDSTTAQSLPGGLSISSGRITGNAPAANGFYVIKLIATLGSETYKRYFVLIVGTGGPGGGATIDFVTPPDTTRCFFDGDFSVAQLAGPPEFEIPFAEDPRVYSYKLPYWQFLSDFDDLAIGAPGPLGGTYVGGAPGSIKTIGGGVIEFKREFALVPDTRSEWESHVYQQAVYFPVIGRSGVAQIPLTVSSRIQFDYFRTDDPYTIDLPKAPVMWTPGTVFFLNGFFEICNSPTGTEILAEDATYKRWKGDIYERRQRFIPWTNPADVIEP